MSNHNKTRRSRLSRRGFAWFLLAFLVSTESLSACSIPVFRFALERWVPDLFEVSVFYRSSLSDTDERRLTHLEDTAIRNGGRLNLEVVRCNLDDDVPADLLTVWKSFDDLPMPAVVVRTPRKGIEQTIVWHGRLNDPFLDTLATSPVRREIAQNLLHGDSVVWLLVRGSDSEQARRARQTLDAALTELSEQIELPVGIGRPGSELLSKVPLHLKFSVVEISRDARGEQILLQLLQSALPQPSSASDSLVAPIFGRGRVLAVQSARNLAPETITDLTTYLCSACSCQVKQQNPGFDLLCEMNWEERLFADWPENASAAANESTADDEVALVSIPPGHAPQTSMTGSNDIAKPSGRGHSGVLVAIVALAVAACLIALRK